MAPGPQLVARMGPLLRRRARARRAGSGDGRARARAEQWIVVAGAIADLSLIAGMRGRRAEQLLRSRPRPVDLARERGLLDSIEVGEVHTAYGAALAAHGRPEAALPALERRGHAATAVGPAARPRRRAAGAGRGRGGDGRWAARERAARRGRRDPRRVPSIRVRCPARLAAARRALGGGPAAGATAAGELSERERTVLRLSERRAARSARSARSSSSPSTPSTAT